jgi:hypothetical protein
MSCYTGAFPQAYAVGQFVNRLNLKSRRTWLLGIVALVIVVFGADWMLARSRLDNIAVAMSANPERVVANGTDKTTITVRFTEDGQPRVGDLIQLWLVKGSGQLSPTWVYTDAAGVVVVTYTPNPYSRYEPQDGAEIAVLDTSIGRLIEVGKQSSIVVPLDKPE